MFFIFTEYSCTKTFLRRNLHTLYQVTTALVLQEKASQVCGHLFYVVLRVHKNMGSLMTWQISMLIWPEMK